ncbi:hypothetical protein ACH5RR_030290 [Cinchona calisaya]|uniref:Uncharacterized protein n=1 Tax=Cinchona calisaya TaxID=153742 RepID=A0ABD2YVJ5_9GENT
MHSILEDTEFGSFTAQSYSKMQKVSNLWELIRGKGGGQKIGVRGSPSSSAPSATGKSSPTNTITRVERGSMTVVAAPRPPAP